MSRPRRSAPRAITLAVATSLLLTILPFTTAVAAKQDGPIVTGILKDAAGQQTAGELYLYAVSPDSTEVPLVAAGTADLKGRFALRGRHDGAIGRLAAGNGGWARFWLVAIAGAATSEIAFSRRATGGSWQAPQGQSTALTMTASTKMSDRTRSALEAMRTRASSATAGDSTASVCQRIELNHGTKWTDVGEIHTWTDESGTFSYGASADSDVDVKVSAAGSSWSGGGSYHVGNSTGITAGWPVGAKDRHIMTVQMDYHEWWYTPECLTSWPYRIEAGLWIVGNGNPPIYQGGYGISGDGTCLSKPSAWRINLANGSFITKSTARNIRYGVAVTVFGVNLGATSGYSSRVDLTLRAGTGSVSHYYCGNDDTIVNAHVILAGG